MCTSIRFTDGKGSLYFGRNLDWSRSYGEHVIITPRNFERTWAYGDTKTSAYAVIGMGIVAEGLPLYFDCANEAGLAVAGLNFPGFAQYEQSPIEGDLNVAAYEFPLWITSCFASVDEVEDALEYVNIVAKAVNEQYPVSLLHWFVADSKRSIAVEATAEGLCVHHDPVDVLTNQPDFGWQLENLRNYISLTSDFPIPAVWRDAALSAYGSGSGMRGLPGDYYSSSRFVRAAYFNANYPVQEGEASNISRLFHTLSSVAMIEGAARMESGDFEKTVYTSGYSARTKTYHWSTYEDPAIKSVAMSVFNLDSTNLIEA